MKKSASDVFDKYCDEYEEWFDNHKCVYRSEIEAVRRFLPPRGTGIEIGVGTGRFSEPFGIRVGIEPAGGMADIARRKGIAVYDARAESTPFGNNSFDFALFVTVICFLGNPLEALREARRIIKPGGRIIIGMIDRGSPLGRAYEHRKSESKFYRNARFRSVRQVIRWLQELGCEHIETCQTLFGDVIDITSDEPVKDGYGEGGFVVISARKKTAL